MMMPKAIWELGNLYLGHLPSTCGTWRENDASCQYPSLHKIILDFAQLDKSEILIFLMDTNFTWSAASLTEALPKLETVVFFFQFD